MLNENAYPIVPEKWATTPIKRTLNPKTGWLEGEDGDKPEIRNPGYRGMPTLGENSEELVVPASIEQRSSFDGFNEYGHPHDSNIVLPGGLEGGILVVREAVARCLEYAQRLLDQLYGGEFRIIALDGFESYTRQIAGFTRVLKGLLKEEGIKEPSITQLFELGKKANGMYAWVNANKNTSEYEAIKIELLANVVFMQEVQTIANSQGIEVDEVLFKIITISANSNVGPSKDRKVPFNYENNAHAGGGAVDIMIVDKKGTLANLIPYCWIGEEAGMDYMENSENYKDFVSRAKTDKALQLHLKHIGFSTVEAFTFQAWERLCLINRIKYHLMKALGCTYYSAHNPKEGGENWHVEPGNVLYSPTGEIIWRAPTADIHPNSGNPGHTLQILGARGVAVYGGRSGHFHARRKFKLAA